MTEIRGLQAWLKIIQNQQMPALDVVVEDFELRGKKLGRLEIDAVNRGEAVEPLDEAACLDC